MECLKTFTGQEHKSKHTAHLMRSNQGKQAFAIGDYVMLLQKRTVSVVKIPQPATDILIGKKALKVILKSGNILNYKFQDSFDLTCQMMAIKSYFQQDNQGFIQHNQQADFEVLKYFESDFQRFVENQFQDMLSLLQETDTPIVETIKHTSFYLFLQDLLKISVRHPSSFMNRQNLFQYYKGL